MLFKEKIVMEVLSSKTDNTSNVRINHDNAIVVDLRLEYWLVYLDIVAFRSMRMKLGIIIELASS